MLKTGNRNREESEVENMAKFGINDILNAKTKAAGQQAQTEGYKEIYLSPYEVKAAQENTHQKLENMLYWDCVIWVQRI